MLVKGAYTLYNVYAWANSAPSVLHFSAFISYVFGDLVVIY